MEGRAFQAFVLALITSAVGTFCVFRAALSRRLLIDAPNQRSSHAQPKPRGGGVGILAALVLGSALLTQSHAFDRAALSLLMCALVCAVIGFWDDVWGLAVLPRLLVETVMAAWFVSQTGPLARLPLPIPLDLPLGFFGFVFPVVWLVGVTNFFNFMDGIDGLATGQAIVLCLAVVLAGWDRDSTLVALVLLGGLLGFLPFNWWPSRIFLGDVGSLPIGFLLAGLPLLAPGPERGRAVLAVAIGLTLFLLDPVLILWRRWRRGDPLGQSHREHLYQQFLGQGDPHAKVTTALVGAGLGLAAAGLMVYRSPTTGWLGVLLAWTAFTAERILAKRASRR